MVALSHFSHSAAIERVVELTTLSAAKVQLTLGELRDRGLVAETPDGDAFTMEAASGLHIRRLRPEQVEEAGNRLTANLRTFVAENGSQNYDRYSRLEAAWTTVGPAVRAWVATGIGLAA